MSDHENKSFEGHSLAIATFKLQRQQITRQIEIQSAAKVETIQQQQAAANHAAELKRKVDDSTIEGQRKRTKIRSVEANIAALEAELATIQAALAQNETSTAEYQGRQNEQEQSEATLGQTVADIEATLLGLNADGDRVMTDSIEEKDSTRATLQLLRERFDGWFLVQVKDSGVLLYPMPYTATKEKFSGHATLLKRALAFPTYLSNPEYLFGRLLTIANQCANDHRAAKFSEISTSDKEAILCAMEKADPERLQSVGHQARLIIRLNTLFAAEVKAEEDQLKASVPPRVGNHYNMAKATVANRWAVDHKSRSTMPDKNAAKAIKDLSQQIMADARAGEELKPVFEKFGPAAAFVLPWAEYLKIGNHGNFRACAAYVAPWLIEILGDKYPDLVRCVKSLCKLVHKYECFDKEFDLLSFTEQLNVLREEHGLSNQPTYCPHYSLPVGDWSYQLQGSASGFNHESNHDIKLKDAKGEAITTTRPSEIFEPLIGFHKKPRDGRNEAGPELDLNGRAVRLAMHLHTTATTQRDISVIPAYDVVINKASEWVCLVEANGSWVATRLNVVVDQDLSDPAQPKEVYLVDHITILNPLGDVEANQGAKDLMDRTLAEIRKVYTTRGEETLKVCSWPVQALHNPHVSGIHAVCHGMALVNVGTPWLDPLTEEWVYEMRHFLLRRITREFSRVVSQDEA